MAFSHYIFGYGSLICPFSRAITTPTLADRAATPVRVKHLERLWSQPIHEWGMTAMGIRVKQNAECVGVLVPVDEKELAQFDAREARYNRLPIANTHIERISFLSDDEHYNHHHSYFHQAIQAVDLPNIWVYVPQNHVPVSVECPIAQTYVDVILRGCLTISEEFAQDFLITTRGWHPKDFEVDVSDRHEGEAFWVNDRNNPLYVRADTEYSKSSGHELDRLLEASRPELIHRHHFYGRSSTV